MDNFKSHAAFNDVMHFERFCKVCPESVHCCIFKGKKGFAFLTQKDAERIKKNTKKEFDEFMDYSPLNKKMIEALKNDDPLLEGGLRYSQLDKKKRILRLRTKKNGRCIFLADNGKCSIYDIRPSICRIYPFWGIRLMSGKIKIIEHDINPKCGIIKSLKKKDKKVDEALSKDELIEAKGFFKNIEKESLSKSKGL